MRLRIAYGPGDRRDSELGPAGVDGPPGPGSRDGHGSLDRDSESVSLRLTVTGRLPGPGTQ